MKTLRERLANWIDFDGAAYELGVALGIFEQEWGGGVPGRDDPWHGTKGIFWSANPLGDALDQMLRQMVKAGVLEFDVQGLRYRWNPSYVGPVL